MNPASTKDTDYMFERVISMQ